MLDEIDKIDWSTLEHAYGSASDTPQFLRDLASREPSVRNEAFHGLFGSVWHQGTVYSASAYVVPFLFELLQSPEVSDKDSISTLLACIASGRGYYEVHVPLAPAVLRNVADLDAKLERERRNVAAVRSAVSPRLLELLPLLQNAVPDVRTFIAEALPYYPEHAPACVAALERARRQEEDEEVMEAIDRALSQITKPA